jgi:hypothetical protein
MQRSPNPIAVIPGRPQRASAADVAGTWTCHGAAQEARQPLAWKILARARWTEMTLENVTAATP